MLSPKRVKYRKQQRGRRKGTAGRGNRVSYGDFALVAMEPAWITARQIEAGRVAISRSLKKGGKIFIRLFPDKPISKKPLETRMGTGKGGVEFWVAVVQPGRVMFEIGGVTEALAREAFTLCNSKLPIATKVVRRVDQEF